MSVGFNVFLFFQLFYVMRSSVEQTTDDDLVKV